MAAQPSLIDGKPLWLEEATRSGHLFKSKPAAAVLCSRRSTACVRQRERAQPGFERGSAQHPCQRRDWNVIYRMYRAYLSSCIFWSLAVPVASMVMLDGICKHAVTTYVLGSVQWSNNDVKKLFTHTCTSAHGPRRFFARSAYIFAPLPRKSTSAQWAIATPHRLRHPHPLVTHLERHWTVMTQTPMSSMTARR